MFFPSKQAKVSYHVHPWTSLKLPQPCSKLTSIDLFTPFVFTTISSIIYNFHVSFFDFSGKMFDHVASERQKKVFNGTRRKVVTITWIRSIRRLNRTENTRAADAAQVSDNSSQHLLISSLLITYGLLLIYCSHLSRGGRLEVSRYVVHHAGAREVWEEHNMLASAHFASGLRGAPRPTDARRPAPPVTTPGPAPARAGTELFRRLQLKCWLNWLFDSIIVYGN